MDEIPPKRLTTWRKGCTSPEALGSNRLGLVGSGWLQPRGTMGRARASSEQEAPAILMILDWVCKAFIESGRI